MAIRVIDTDVWSYLYKARDEAKLYEPHLFGNILVICFQTEAELLRGALAANWGERRRQHLESRIRKYVVERSSRELRYVGEKRWRVRAGTGDLSPPQMRGLPRLRCASMCR